MKDKGHFITSLIKSVLRITAYIICATTITLLAIPMIILAVSEIGGILEEFLDRR